MAGSLSAVLYKPRWPTPSNLDHIGACPVGAGRRRGARRSREPFGIKVMRQLLY